MSWWHTCPKCGQQVGVVRKLGVVDEPELDPIVEIVLFDDEGHEISRSKTSLCPCGHDFAQ